jgi:hypothetical protein
MKDTKSDYHMTPILREINILLTSILHKKYYRVFFGGRTC